MEADPKIIHVVEGEACVRDMLQELLAQQGFHVQAFDSAENYLAFMKTAHFRAPSALLSDAGTLEMDGIALMRLMHKQHPGVRRMLMTGNPPELVEDHLNQTGLTDCVHHVFTKPFHFPVLMEALKQI